MSAQEIEMEDQVSMTMDNGEILDSGSSDCGDSNSANVSDGLGDFTANGMMVRLDEGSVEHEKIKKCFVSSMGFAGRFANIVAIHTNNVNSDLRRKARLESFKIFHQAVAQKRGGDGNIKFAWYGGSRDEICEIMLHGFSTNHQCNRGRGPPFAPNAADDQSFYGGVGVHMIPPKFVSDAAVISEAAADLDESGQLSHILLCRVIVGKMEVVGPGSKQSHPSSKEVDTGVDNLILPRRYIVWGAFANSHILPCHVVSFKGPTTTRQAMENAFNPTTTTSPGMTFSDFMSLLSKHLPPQKMEILAKCHDDFKANKITRPQMIQSIRENAGDMFLIALLRAFKTKEGKWVALGPAI